MAIIKCKMCGGDLALTEGSTVALCEYCGTQQTVPTADDEKKLIQFERAERLRRQCEFDKAAGIYETIVSDFRHEAEAYWGLVLCKYGIEYVTDPASGKKIPTCHRSSYDSIFDDSNFDLTLENADAVSLQVYRQEAKQIENIRRGIVEVSAKEEPYDIFICYKETDDKGDRTVDSLIAQEIYEALMDKGYRVFFSRISLEDKLGEAYEPYIFAALNSARIMLAVGTRYEYYNAVWVKNEWSRFLKLMAADKDKHLIPCFKDLDAYDIPREFAHLQAQNMGKVGAMPDLMRGIEKLMPRQAEAVQKAAPVQAVGDTAPLLKRAFMFLEDGDWSSADAYCEKVLDRDPENAAAYLGKLMAELQVRKQEQLRDYKETFDRRQNYNKAFRFGDEKLKQELVRYTQYIARRNEQARLQSTYQTARNKMAIAKIPGDYLAAANIFRNLGGYQDAAELAEKCEELAEYARKDGIYQQAVAQMKRNNETGYRHAAEILKSIPGWKDADEKIGICEQKAEECAIASRVAKAKAEQRTKIRILCVWGGLLLAFVIAVTVFFVREHQKKQAEYNNAVSLMEEGNYFEAVNYFNYLADFSDSQQKVLECYYLWGEKLMKQGYYTEAIAKYTLAGDYSDSKEKIAQYEKETEAHLALIQPHNLPTTISAGGGHTVGLKRDGTVVAVGNNGFGKCDVSDWTDIVAISAGKWHTVGLKKDGTVVAVGDGSHGQRMVFDWTDIVVVSTGAYHTVGLKKDGTVVATGNNENGQCNVSAWTDIVAISAGAWYTVGLKIDGAVVVVGSNGGGQCDVLDWTDIVAVSAGEYHTVGLKKDGTVVATGSNGGGQCDVSDWTDIVAISAGVDHTVGLKKDGTVVAVGVNGDGQCDVSAWTDIVAISAGEHHTVGLKKDGTVVAVGINYDGQSNVTDWENIKLPE